VGPRVGLDNVEERQILPHWECNRAEQPVAVPTELFRLRAQGIPDIFLLLLLLLSVIGLVAVDSAHK
jgi:hypothetical protein